MYNKSGGIKKKLSVSNRGAADAGMAKHGTGPRRRQVRRVAARGNSASRMPLISCSN